jgi:phosphoribosylanthranilate isomerase
MRLPHLPFVKVCCISSLEEAELAIACGASALGLVSEMPSGPGVISDDLIADIAAQVPPPVATFLLTCRQEAEEIIAQHRHCRTTTIQLVDYVPVGQLQRLREGLPGIKLVQVIHVTGPESLEEAQVSAPFVDALLLDSGNQKLAVKELGGTGRTHDWSLSRKIREAAGKPLFLAGGLKPENIAEAVVAVRPFGLDLCSGVRTKGGLDPEKLSAFFEALAGTDLEA